MIVVDIDGTLLPSSGLAISEANRKAVLEAQACGIHVVVATGRRQAYAMPLLEQLGLPSANVIISSNGTITRTFAGETLDRWLLPVNTARALCGTLRGFGGTTVFTFDREGPGELVVESLADLETRVDKWVEANRPYLREVNPLEDAFADGSAPAQGMVCGSVEKMRQAEEVLLMSEFAQLIETHRTEYPIRDLSILDILPPGCSKGSALERLAGRFGISRTAIMAIGDNYNDLEMLRYAGQPVLMSNAPEELQDIAADEGWFITASNDEHGVARAIHRALENKSTRPIAEVNEIAEVPMIESR